jgi:hypothetical protein
MARPSVAKLAIDPAGGRGELRGLGGGKHDEWNQGLTAQLAGALPEARGSMTAATVEGSLGAIYVERRLTWSGGTPTKRGIEAMVTLRPSDAETVDLMFLEHRLPFGWALVGLVFGGNVASAVLMLIGQG